MSVRCYLLFTDMVMGAEGVSRAGGKRRVACINMTVQPARPVNTEQENDTEGV